MNELIDRLSERVGILGEYYDIWGKKHEVSPETKKGILKAMGFDVEGEDALRDAVKERLRPSMLEPVLVVEEESPVALCLHLPGDAEEARFDVSLRDEAGKTRRFSFESKALDTVEFEGERYRRHELVIDASLAIGYYDLFVQAHFGRARQRGTMRLVITPSSCHIPGGDYLPKAAGRSWGLTLCLHSIRSGRNWGIGDFRDLGDIVDWVASLGGDFVGVLPLHSIPLPGDVSPYSPLSRLYRNFIYLDLEGIPEFKAINKGKLKEKIAERITALRQTEFVDYEGVFSLKMDALERMFGHFYKKHYEGASARGTRFRGFMKREGQSLTDYATFMAMNEIHQKGWMDWPEEHRDPLSPRTAAFREGNAKRVLFHAWLQWLICEQLETLGKRAKDKGMRIGLYFDLAVGALGGGADAWGFRDVFAIGSDVGAPPDDFSLNGQNWGFPPLVPEKLRKTGYDIFIKTIRKNLDYGGMLRIDHALGLFRLFWIPEGMTPAEGAYVKYPAHEMLGIIALESKRRGAVIVAEDLGTAGERVREALFKHRMLSYRLFYYERLYPEPVFTPPADYPVLAFCSISTHDLPTIYGFWLGRDIEVRESLSRYPSAEAFERELLLRQGDRQLIVSTLKQYGLLGEDFQTPAEMTEELAMAIYGYLAKTPSLFTAVSLDDWLRSAEQQNMPGTTVEYPNWRRKTPVPIEEFIKGGNTLSEMFRKEGRGR